MLNKKMNNKGFSMVELLAVVVILGVISSIGIVSVSRLVERSRENYYQTQQKQLIMAAQAYVNDNKNVLPKETGGFTTVYLKELYDKKYITDKVVDQNKMECYDDKTVDASGKTIEGSRVEIYKSSKGDYKYVGYLECFACKEDKNSSDSTCYNPKDRLGPDITIDIPDISGNNIMNKNHKITMTIKGNKTNNNIKVSSYSYKIYVDGIARKSSGLVINNKQDTVTIKEDLYKYVPGVVKVVVSTTNTDGISLSKSATRDLKDAVAPQCGRVTYENANAMNAYNSGTSIACGSSGYEWVKIGTNPGTRQGWIVCNDDYGVGCKQHEYSALMTTDGENEIIKIVDKDGKEHDCSIKKCIDRTTSKLTVSIKNGSTVKQTYTVAPQSTNANYSKNDKYNVWLNKTDYPNGVTIEATVEEPTSKIKSFVWKQNPKNKKENQEGDATEVVKNLTSIKETDYTNYTKGIFVQSTTITDDGVRKEVFTVTDKAGNKITYTLILKIDRTPPSPPTISMYREDTTTGKATSTPYTDNTWRNKYVWTTTNHPTDSPNISGWSKNQYTASGSTSFSNKDGDNVNIINEGTTTIKYRSCDAAGNCSTYSGNKTIKLDRQAPKCTVTNSGGTAGTGGWYKGGTVTATGTCSDQSNLSGCKAASVQVQKVNTNSAAASGTTATKDIYDNADNKATCTSTIKYDKSAPTCSISKTHTGTTDGVTLTTTCTDNGKSGVKKCEPKHTEVKSSKSYPVTDNAGNTGSCSKTVTAQRQRKNCSGCKRCSNAGCKRIHYSTKTTYYSTFAGANAGCTTAPLRYCNINLSSTNQLCCKKTETYQDGCDEYYSSCPKCGCNTWGNWYNVSSCSSSSSIKCQTVYN